MACVGNSKWYHIQKAKKNNNPGHGNNPGNPGVFKMKKIKKELKKAKKDLNKAKSKVKGLKKKVKPKSRISKKVLKLPVKKLNSTPRNIPRNISPISVGIVILLIMIILAVWGMEGYGD